MQDFYLKQCVDEIQKGNSEEINSKKILDFSKIEFIQIKLFEVYFIRVLTNHFDKVAKLIIKKEEMYLSTIKFKNMYVLEILTNEILFDLMALRVI